MKRLLCLLAVVGLMAVLSSIPALAQNCSNPPHGFGSAWWQSYAKWCTDCCGKPDAASLSCNPGTNWGCKNKAPVISPGYDVEAERERQQAERQREEEEFQRQEEERHRREAEDAQRRQEQFERDKQEALQDMGGISGELGLKGEDAGGNYGLKGVGDTANDGLKDAVASPTKTTECEWGDQGPSVVDLRCLGLDMNKPIVLDWHVARGQQRVFPAQIDPATFQNANYNQGFEALMRTTFSVKDAMDAVAFFKAAKLERPNDALVRNALYLAEGILGARQQKEEEIKREAEQELYHGVAALVTGDVRTANDSIERAKKLDSADANIGAWSRLMGGLEAHYKEGNPGASRLVGNALVFEAMGASKSEIRTLQVAVHMFPKDAYIQAMLWRAQHLNPANPDFSSVAPGAVTKYPPGTTLKPGNPAAAGTVPPN